MLRFNKARFEGRSFLFDQSSNIYQKEIKNFPVSTPENLTADRETLIKNHLRYCYWLSLYFCPSYIPVSEYIGESNLILVEEANKATPENIEKFTNTVRSKVANRLYKNKCDSASPLTVTRTYHQFSRRITKGIEVLKKVYETENICALDVYNQLDSIQATDLIDVVNPFFGIMSLDGSKENEDSYLHEVIPGADLRNETLETYQDIKEKLLVILHKTLTNFEFVVITEAFGLLRSEPKTIAQITGILGVSMKQVYSGYNTGISKLKNKEVREMLITIQNMDISRYTNFEEINKEFEKKYLETLKKNYGENYENKSQKGFEPHEIAWLQENYKKHSIAENLDYINSRRTDGRQISKDHFRRLVAVLGLTSNKTWTDDEESLVRQYYGRISTEELADLLTKQNTTGKIFNAAMIVHKASRLRISKKDVI